MPELLAPADIEACVIDLLTPAMTTADVSTEVPNPRPTDESYVRVTSIGGTIRNLIQLDSRVLIECWDPDERVALDLARHAWALLRGATDSFLGDSGVYATRVESTGPVNFPDSDTRSPRYQFISTITTSLEDYS